MTRTHTALILLLTTGLVAVQDRTARGEAFELAHQASPACMIVIAGKPTPAAKLAALELQYHVLKISGAEIPIRSENDRGQGRRILVGESSATRALGLRSEDFKPQEYLIAFRTNTIVLIGRDWQDTEANRKVEGRPMTGETLQSTRHNIDYWKTVGCPDRSTGPMELPARLCSCGCTITTPWSRP
jgi:hypothetical protein